MSSGARARRLRTLEEDPARTLIVTSPVREVRTTTVEVMLATDRHRQEVTETDSMTETGEDRARPTTTEAADTEAQVLGVKQKTTCHCLAVHREMCPMFKSSFWSL